MGSFGDGWGWVREENGEGGMRGEWPFEGLSGEGWHGCSSAVDIPTL